MSRALTAGSAGSRAAALGLLVLLALLSWLMVIAPIVDTRAALDEQLRTIRTLHERYRTQAVAWQRKAGVSATFEAPTVAVAAAMLQARLEVIVADSGAPIERLEAMALPRDRRAATLEPIGVTIAFTGSTAQLHRILLAIEADEKAMIVDEMTVRADPSSAETSTGDAPETLRIEIRARAFRTRRAAS